MSERPGLFTLDLRPPLLVAGFAAPQRVLSWALARPGFQRAAEVAWLRVAAADLPPGVDAAALLAARLETEGLGAAVGMMTARDLARFRRFRTGAGGMLADCVATVGLANAVRVGEPGGAGHGPGTINLLAALSSPLSEAALVEAVAIAAEARTAAVIEARIERPAGLATGTGTDCIVVAAPDEAAPQPFCGSHTEAGQALGAAVYGAVLAGARDWLADRRR